MSAFPRLALVGLLLPDLDLIRFCTPCNGMGFREAHECITCNGKGRVAPTHHYPLFLTIPDDSNESPATPRGRRYSIAIVPYGDPEGPRIVFGCVEEGRRAFAVLRDLPMPILETMWSYRVYQNARPYKEVSV